MATKIPVSYLPPVLSGWMVQEWGHNIRLSQHFAVTVKNRLFLKCKDEILED